MLRLGVLLAVLIVSCCFAPTEGARSRASTSLCPTFKTCETCVNDLVTRTCGWCNDVCVDTLYGTYNESYCNGTFAFPVSEPTVVQQGDKTVHPQFQSITLRTGDTLVLTYNITPSPFYPVDFYLLMDLSSTMQDDLTNIQNISAILADTLAELTTDYQIGFGTFIEKTATPFTNVDFRYGLCGLPSWGFRNNLPLQTDKQTFIDSVNETCASGNEDEPEQSLDALYQAVVCTNYIGWGDEDRRKIIMLITDDTFHYAGDSELLGIYDKHDGLCHMSITADPAYPGGIYDRFDGGNLDRWEPSVAQTRAALQAAEIIPLIATTSEAYEFYEQLHNYFGYGGLGTVDADSSNVIELLRDQYKLISETIKLTVSSDPHGFIQSIVTYCPTGLCNYTDHFEGVKPGTTVLFNVTVSSQTCIPVSNVSLTAIGFGTVTLNINMECTCVCNDTNIANVTCTGNGYELCGLCQCNSGWFGPQCTCNQTTLVNAPCAMFDGLQCSGRGSCICGECSCSSTPVAYDGDACECVSVLCPQSGGLVCAGHGDCGCNGTCIECDAGWAHPSTGIQDCSCNLDINACPLDSFGSRCNGVGSCVCGSCVCLDGYSGANCENCNNGLTTCPLANQAICDSSGSCSACTSATNSFGDVNICIWCETTQACYAIRESAAQTCASQKNVTAQCPLETSASSIPAIVGSAIGVALLGILIIVLWKVLTMRKDKALWQEWNEKQQVAKWNSNENPLYAKQVQEFDNPTFFSQSAL